MEPRIQSALQEGKKAAFSEISNAAVHAGHSLPIAQSHPFVGGRFNFLVKILQHAMAAVLDLKTKCRSNREERHRPINCGIRNKTFNNITATLRKRKLEEQKEEQRGKQQRKRKGRGNQMLRNEENSYRCIVGLVLFRGDELSKMEDVLAHIHNDINEATNYAQYTTRSATTLPRHRFTTRSTMQCLLALSVSLSLSLSLSVYPSIHLLVCNCLYPSLSLPCYSPSFTHPRAATYPSTCS
jgi:hypothetical protein